MWHMLIYFLRFKYIYIYIYKMLWKIYLTKTQEKWGWSVTKETNRRQEEWMQIQRNKIKRRVCENSQTWHSVALLFFFLLAFCGNYDTFFWILWWIDCSKNTIYLKYYFIFYIIIFEIYSSNVVVVTFDQLNAFLLNKPIRNFLSKSWNIYQS